MRTIRYYVALTAEVTVEGDEPVSVTLILDEMSEGTEGPDGATSPDSETYADFVTEALRS